MGGRAQAGCGCPEGGAVPPVDPCQRSTVQLTGQIDTDTGISFVIVYPTPYAADPWIVGILDLGVADPACQVTWEIYDRSPTFFRLLVQNGGPVLVDLTNAFFHYQACPAAPVQQPENFAPFVCFPG